MIIIQRWSVATLWLVLCGALLIPVGFAQSMFEAPMPPEPGARAMQMADASSNWAIRPAEEVDPSMQMPGAESDIGGIPPPGDVRSAEINSADGISYVSGGVGEGERARLSAVANDFNLHLMFATQGSGEYLSAVRVSILDTKNSPVLTAVSEGPWFYVQLAPGTYNVEVTPTGARGEGQTQRKTVNLGDSGRAQMDFYWKQ
jgi:hypothetical protein